jgi:hypothetical protein
MTCRVLIRIHGDPEINTGKNEPKYEENTLVDWL